VDDDDGFRRWVRENPDGWVVNANRGDLPSEVKLHRAWCETITRARVALTKDYVKYCGPTRMGLVLWSTARLGRPPGEGCHCLGPT
jgi:hypothetical protein